MLHLGLHCCGFSFPWPFSPASPGGEQTCSPWRAISCGARGRRCIFLGIFFFLFFLPHGNVVSGLGGVLPSLEFNFPSISYSHLDFWRVIVIFSIHFERAVTATAVSVFHFGYEGVLLVSLLLLLLAGGKLVPLVGPPGSRPAVAGALFCASPFLCYSCHTEMLIVFVSLLAGQALWCPQETVAYRA